MNTLRILFVCAWYYVLTASVYATLILDDFSSDEFSLAHGGTTSYSAAFASPLTDQRSVSGVGFHDWAAVLAAGELLYKVNQSDFAPGRNYLSLTYSSSGAEFGIHEYSAFSFELSNVVGTGELIASVSGTSGGDLSIPIVASGTIVSPFSNLDTSASLDALSAMNFRFRAFSQDFSVTIDNVSLIPEPVTCAYLLLGAAGLLATSHIRRRTPPS